MRKCIWYPGGVKIKSMTVMCIFWASGPKYPPPPQPPFLTPHTYEKGVNLLRIQAAICLHSCAVVMPNNAIPDELQGKNWLRTLLH